MAKSKMPDKTLGGTILIDEKSGYGVEMKADGFTWDELVGVTAAIGQMAIYKVKEEGKATNRDVSKVVSYLEQCVVSWYTPLMEEFRKAYDRKKI